MSQTAYKEALKAGEYSLANLAETSEAEKSADIIMSMLVMPDSGSELKMQIIKNRDGACPPPTMVSYDYRSCWFGEKQTRQVVSSLLDDV